jgi:hypothetical protein
MSTEKEDQNWLEALSGKQIVDKSSPETIEAQELRSAILQKLQNEEKFEPSNAAYQKILEEAKNRKLLKDSKKGWNWFELTGGSGFSISGGALATPTYAIASVVLIVGLGAIAGYQALELREINSRAVSNDIFRGIGSNEAETAKAKISISAEVTIKSATPLTQANSIINSALDSKLIVEAARFGGGYQVIIYGMHAMSKDEVALKAVLGIPNQTEGSIRVIIKN